MRAMAVLGKPQFYLQKKGDLLRRRRAGRAGAEQWGPFRAEWSDVSVRFDPYLGDKPIDDETALKVANRLKYKDRDVAEPGHDGRPDGAGAVGRAAVGGAGGRGGRRTLSTAHRP